MVAASQFSILAGGSLGPEAPLVAICASLGGFCSRTLFRIEDRNLVRKHTLMVRLETTVEFFVDFLKELVLTPGAGNGGSIGGILWLSSWRLSFCHGSEFSFRYRVF